MTNPVTKRGFYPIGRLDGAPKYLTEMVYIDGGVATAVFKGDLMKAVGDSVTTQKLRTADVMTAQSDDMLGSVLGLYNANGTPAKYLAASTAGYALICSDQNAIYDVKTADSGTPLTQVAIGDCADAIWDHAGDTATGIAGVELSETLAGAAASAQFKIKGIIEIENNDWGVADIRVQVYPVEHHYKKVNAI